MLGFNDTSTFVGYFVSSPKEREKRERRDSGDGSEGRKKEEQKGKGRNKTFPSTLTSYKNSKPCPTQSQYQLDAPVTQDTRHLRHTRPPPGPVWSIIKETGNVANNTPELTSSYTMHFVCKSDQNWTKIKNS